jgi:hypothetical protein
MVEVKLVSLKELSDPNENPTFCLSPLRVFDKCHECDKFKRAQAGNRVDKLGCKPHVNPKYLELLERKRQILKQLRQIEEEMSTL